MSSVGDLLSDTFDQITGKSAQEAATEAARLQSQAGNRAIDLSNEAQLRLEETLAPFVSALGTDLLPQISTLFGDPTSALTNDPVLSALADRGEDRILAGQAARGRVGADAETGEALQENFLRLGTDLLGRRQSSLLDALRFGQSSAAQTGVSGLNTASRTGDILSQIANTQGAAGIAGQQARRQGIFDVTRFGGGLLGSLFGGGGA